MNHNLKIVPIGTPDLRNVPESLRLLADKIESGELPGSIHAVIVSIDPEGNMDVYGYGDIQPRLYEVGLLHTAAAKLTL